MREREDFGSLLRKGKEKKRGGKLTDHNNKRKNIIKDNPKRWGELLEPGEIRRLHHAVGHGLDDEARHFGIIVHLIHADEGLQKAHHDDDQQREENEGFLHHDFQHDEHGAEEAEGVEVQQQAHPEHGCAEGEEVVGEFVEMGAFGFARVVAEGDHAGDEGGAEQGVKGRVEDVPETDVVPTDLVELGEFVEEESGCHEVEDAFDDVEVARVVDGVDGDGVQDEVEYRKEDLHGVLVERCAHPVWVQMGRVNCVGFVLVGHEAAWVLIVLYQPSAPEIGDAFLVPGATDHTQAVQVHGALDHVGRLGLLPIDQDAIPLQQKLFEQVRLVVLHLDDLLRQYLACRRARVVHVSVPQLEEGLSSEPPVAD